MKNPNPDMLLRIAQGDAYAASTEYIKFPRDQAVYDEALKFEGYGRHPTHDDLRPGWYTDDTQMSLAVAEVLLGERPFTREKFADAFVRCFKRDQRGGYSRNFQVFLESVSSGAEFMEKIRPNSDKNGAAMRSVPIGVLPDPIEALMVAEWQAKLTHDTPDGVFSAQAVTLMSHFALHSDEPMTPENLWEFISDFGVGMAPEHELFSAEWPGGPVKGPRVGFNTARAVFHLVTRCKSLSEILATTIQWGGDTDSVAAIAWGIASTRMRPKLPGFFEATLEPDRQYGSEFLKDLGAKLMAKFANETEFDHLAQIQPTLDALIEGSDDPEFMDALQADQKRMDAAWVKSKP